MKMRILVSALVALLTPFALQAQRAIIVDAAGGGDFTEIQPAIDSAAPGSLIRVRHGTYRGAVIHKGLHLIGDRPDQANDLSVLLDGSIRVLDLPAGQSFVATDLVLLDPGNRPYSFDFENCRGNVHLAASEGRLVVRTCSYVTVDLVQGVSSFDMPGALIEDSFVVSTDSEWTSFTGVHEPMVTARSKLILVDSKLMNWNNILFIPAPQASSAIQIVDSDLVFTDNSQFTVNCNFVPGVCPPEMVLVGNSTARNVGMDNAFFRGTRDPDRLQLVYSAGDSALAALVVGASSTPFDAPEGTFYIDLTNSSLLHLGPPPPPPGFIRIDLLVPAGNRLGIPITFQGAVQRRDGVIELGLPFTVVL